MVIEERKVKGVTKKYKSRKTNRTKETLVKSVYLGTDSKFEVDEKVVVLSYDDYEKLKENTQIIEKQGLNTDELKNELESMKESCNENYMKISKQKDEIINLTKQINEKEKEIARIKESKSSELDKAKNMIIKLEEEKNMKSNRIEYLNEIIHEYEKQNLLARIMNKNPKNYIQIKEFNLIETSSTDKDNNSNDS